MCSDDPGGDYPNTRLVLQELCINDVTLDDCRHVQHVCWQVSQRAAHLAATGNHLVQVIITIIIINHHHHVACPEADVAVPTSLLHACRFCAR